MCSLTKPTNTVSGTLDRGEPAGGAGVGSYHRRTVAPSSGTFGSPLCFVACGMVHKSCDKSLLLSLVPPSPLASLCTGVAVLVLRLALHCFEAALPQVESHQGDGEYRLFWEDYHDLITSHQRVASLMPSSYPPLT